MMREIIVTSMLPPEMTATTLPLVSNFLPMIAATADAPAPSATILPRSIRNRIACAISSSSTVTTSSTYFWHISNVSSPGCLTAMPSAMVFALVSATTCPASSDAFMPAAPAACTPTMRTFGCSIFTAAATPEASPPPPMGTTMVSTSGRSSMISRPIVPWPAMTIGSLNGWMNVAPVSFCRVQAMA